jgi:luciferase family oxidoreductase group 1
LLTALRLLALRLSALDFDTPACAVTFACELDEMGYHRYWLGEHHSPAQCANPLLLGALIAAATSGIRIGSGGVCLSFASPYRVAEDARLIESLLPGRFDLGVTRGLREESSLMTAVLDGRSFDALPEYSGKFADLHGYVTGRLPAGHPLHGHRPYLHAGGPPIWHLGVGLESARLAAQYGTGFCFSLHHAAPGVDGGAQVQEYKSRFQPSPEHAEPAVIVVVSCVCAATEAEARLYEKKRAETAPLSKAPSIVGSPEQCAEAFDQLCRRLQVDEIMVLDLLGSPFFDARLEMYRLLAQEVGLVAPVATAS